MIENKRKHMIKISSFQKKDSMLLIPKLGVLYNIFTCMLTTYKVGLMFILQMWEIKIRKPK